MVTDKSQNVAIDAIRIYPCFAENPPSAEKMGRKEQYFKETGALQSQIILDSEGNLIDGYTSYLLAKSRGIRSVPVWYGKRQLVRARHKSGGKLYAWELPAVLIDCVSAGDKVLVHTQRGSRTATVESVEDYAGNNPKRLKLVIRIKGK